MIFFNFIDFYHVLYLRSMSGELLILELPCWNNIKFLCRLPLLHSNEIDSD